MMDTTIGSSKIPFKHLNRCLKTPWRFKREVTVEKKASKRKQKIKEKKINSKASKNYIERANNKAITQQKITKSYTTYKKKTQNTAVATEVDIGGLWTARGHHAPTR
jgi:hypothetical protein